MVGHYIHPGSKVGVLVEVNCETDFVAKTADFQALVRDVAMHIAGTPYTPLYVAKEEVPAEVLEKEKEIYRAQARAQGKPPQVVDKIADGKLKDYYSSFVLLEQPYIRDDKKTVGQLIQEKIALIKENIVVRRFARFKVGEAMAAPASGETGEPEPVAR
jgi:elongation factor Ts